MNLRNLAHAQNGPQDPAMLSWGAMLESEGEYPTLFTPGGPVFSKLLGSQGIVVTLS